MLEIRKTRLAALGRTALAAGGLATLAVWLLAPCLPGSRLAGAAEPAAAANAALVFEHVSVFDPASKSMLPDRTVVVQGERIVAVGSPESPVDAPAGAKAIAADGKFLLPGLIDAHVHLVHVLDFAQVTADEVLPLFLEAGVTSLRDTGDEIVAETLAARYAESHPDLCPRVFTCSPLIDADPPFHRDIGRAVTDPAQAPAFVAEMKRWGVTTLKLYVGTQRPVGRAIVEEAHRQGLPVTAHLGNYSAQDAVQDGVDCLEHIWSVFNYIVPPEVAGQPNHRATLDLHNPLADGLIAELVANKTRVDPTLVVFRNMIYLNDLPEVHNHPDHARVPRRLHAWWSDYRVRSNLKAETQPARRQEIAKYQELTLLLHRAGVPILAGTDAPEPYVPPGYSLHQELELLVEAGLTPAEALVAATQTNAEALRRADSLGSIEPGKLADLVLLDANPLEDIRHTRRIVQVVRGGRLVDLKRVAAAVSK